MEWEVFMALILLGPMALLLVIMLWDDHDRIARGASAASMRSSDGEADGSVNR